MHPQWVGTGPGVGAAIGHTSHCRAAQEEVLLPLLGNRWRRRSRETEGRWLRPLRGLCQPWGVAALTRTKEPVQLEERREVFAPDLGPVPHVEASCLLGSG